VRKSLQLSKVEFRLDRAGPNSVLLFAAIRNEMLRLPDFLAYYRRLGIGHFCFVDNESTDGSALFLAKQGDCSVWKAAGGYRAANFGIDWLNFLINRHANGRWILAVDADELLVYPHCDTRDLNALTHWLDVQGQKSFSAMQIDLYSRDGQSSSGLLRNGDLLAADLWFDAANYTYSRNPKYRTLWIQGGPRQRRFFAANPENAPALNKIPLVKWRRGYVFVSSAHVLLPSMLNQAYAVDGGERICGGLLHTKLLDDFRKKAEEELGRRQHFSDSREYAAYLAPADSQANFWDRRSSQYQGWQSLENCGLISQGGWF